MQMQSIQVSLTGTCVAGSRGECADGNKPGSRAVRTKLPQPAADSRVGEDYGLSLHGRQNPASEARRDRMVVLLNRATDWNFIKAQRELRGHRTTSSSG